MLTLSFDTTAKTASVALSDGEKLLGVFTTNGTLPHSENLLYMADALLSSCGAKIADVEALAVCTGPGSFTGVRIGVAAVKGLALAKDLPVAPVSTLEALSENVFGTDAVICAAMDARRGQVYGAAFAQNGGENTRLSEDLALTARELCEKAAAFCEKSGKKSVIFVGDGAELCYNEFTENFGASGITPLLAPPHLRFQNAASVAKAARKILDGGGAVSGKKLACVYLRKPQAEQ